MIHFRSFFLLFCLAMPLTLSAQQTPADTAVIGKRLDSLYQRARALYRDGNQRLGRPAANGCLEETAKFKDLFPRRYANALDVRASFYFGVRDSGYEENFLEARQIRLDLLGDRHPDFARSENNLGAVARGRGQYEKADALFRRAADIWRDSVGPTSIWYSNALHNIALNARDAGQFDTAHRYFRQTLDIRRNLDSTYEYAVSLRDMGAFYLDIGDWVRADSFFFAAKDSFKTLGNNQQYALALNNLASLCARTGQFKKARALYDEMGAAVAETEGTNSENYATYCNNVGNLYQQQGQYDTAEVYLTQALNIRAANKGAPFARTLVSLSKVHILTDQYEKAFLELEEAVALLKNARGSLAYQAAIQNLASVCQRKGLHARAATLYSELLYLREHQVGGKNQPEYAQALRMAADFQQGFGNTRSADSLFAEANDALNTQFAQTGQYASEAELLEYLKLRQSEWDYFFGLAGRDSTAQHCGWAYDNILLLRNAALQNLLYIAAMREKPDSIRQIFDDWQAKKRLIGENLTRLSNLKRLDPAVEEANRLEKQLLANVDFANVQKQVKWKEVQQALAPGSVAIEFIAYKRYPEGHWKSDSLMYAALVLQPGAEAPVFVSLCNQLQLQEGLKYNYTPSSRSVAEGNISATYQNPALYRLLWKPIEKKCLSASDTLIYFAPAGDLYRINFAAFQDENNALLTDRYAFIQLGSTRQLVAPYVPLNAPVDPTSTAVTINRGPNPGAKSGLSAILYGGIAYAADSLKLAEHARPCVDIQPRGNPEYHFAPQPSGGSRAQRDGFEPLPGTIPEIYALKDVLETAGYHVDDWIGYEANEDCFQFIGQREPAPHVLHIGSHGFFNPKDSVREGGGGLPFIIHEHPLMRCGLAFAGANRVWQHGRAFAGMQDGIATAYEISQMNLRGTELVVLSACGSGLGDIVGGGEGVFGLQRAFKIAGAHYIVMSLWNVPDDEKTRYFLTSFYSKWLDGVEIHAAFRAAQREQQARGIHPYYWAGFVLVE